MKRLNQLMIMGLALGSFSCGVQATPLKKEICPAPTGIMERNAAVNAACQHYNGVRQSWGMHKAFNSSGQVINCIHFTCKPAPGDEGLHGVFNPNPGPVGAADPGPAGAADPGPAGAADPGPVHGAADPAPEHQSNNQPAATPKRFSLKLRDAYLVHNPSNNILQIAAQGNVLSYGRDWQVRKMKPYLYHFKQNNWRGFYWAVNTSRGEVYRVKNGSFGQLGGTKQKLHIGVDAVGNANNPTRFFLRLRDASLVHQVGRSGLQIASQGNVLSYGGDWQVRKLKPYLYHFKQNNWRGFHWQINTSRKEAYRVKNGSFGRIGGNKTRLHMGISPTY